MLGLQGRVWAGQAALGEKLVDVLGGLTMAKNVARKLAGLGKSHRSSSTDIHKAAVHDFTVLTAASAGCSMLIHECNEERMQECRGGSAAFEMVPFHTVIRKGADHANVEQA